MGVDGSGVDGSVDGAAGAVTTRGSGVSHERWMLAAAIVLSLTTLASAWSGYQAARWGGEASKANRAANVARLESSRQAAIADRQLTVDVMVFSSWLEVEIEGNGPLAAAFRDRFRPDFLPAFEAWYADSVDGELPPGTPFDHEQYLLPATVESDRLLVVAQGEADRADEASQTADNFVLTAVLYASVLFLAGIASKTRTTRSSHVAVTLSVAMFVVATWIVFTLPFNVGF